MCVYICQIDQYSVFILKSSNISQFFINFFSFTFICAKPSIFLIKILLVKYCWLQFFKMVFQCCVRGCKTVAKNGLHSFPSNKSQAQKWIEAIKTDDLMDLLTENKLSRSYRKVCRKHFSETDFQPNENGKSQLLPNSVPSILLPETVVIK